MTDVTTVLNKTNSEVENKIPRTIGLVTTNVLHRKIRELLLNLINLMAQFLTRNQHEHT